MNDKNSDLAGRRGGIDPAALAVASLASAVSVIAPPGPYSPGSIIIGLTILIVIYAYDIDPHRTKGQSLAFSSVLALISVLVLGYPMELLWATDKLKRLQVLLQEVPQDIPHSEVRPVFILGLWVLMVLVYYWLDRRRLEKAKHKEGEYTQGLTTR